MILDSAMSGDRETTASYSAAYLNQYTGDTLLAVIILFVVLVPASVNLRFYARRLGDVKWGLDDTLGILGTIFCLALCASALGE